MRKNLMLVALSCLAVLAAVPARADETHMLGENTSLTVGYKLWLNTWEWHITLLLWHLTLLVCCWCRWLTYDGWAHLGWYGCITQCLDVCAW